MWTRLWTSGDPDKSPSDNSFVPVRDVRRTRPEATSNVQGLGKDGRDSNVIRRPTYAKDKSKGKTTKVTKTLVNFDFVEPSFQTKKNLGDQS